MRYIIDISQIRSKQIESLIEAKLYESVNQFVSVALENQLHIEKAEDTSRVKNNSASKDKKYFTRQKSHDLKGFPDEDIELYLPIPDEAPAFVDPPAFSQLVEFLDDIDEKNSWMWGQFNRIFPVKLALRFLLIKLGKEHWIELEDYKEEAARKALICGKALDNYEAEKGKKRDEKISAALPKAPAGSASEFKSLTRYKEHFIGGMRRDDHLVGAMPFLRFANFKRDGSRSLIGMTEAGYRFAILENPVIDLRNYESSFGEQEIDFYLDHITKNVKGEFSAIKWLLNKIAGGISERTAINEILEKEYGKIWKVKPAVINTQRAGLMARMYELRLIEKKKEGITVKYSISQTGNIFLNKLQ